VNDGEETVVQVGEITFRVRKYGCSWEVQGSVGLDPEPGTPIGSYTGSDLNLGLQSIYDRIADALGLEHRWDGDVPGRDDLLIELRETLAGLDEIIAAMKRTHKMRLAHIPGLEQSIYEAQSADGRPPIADAMIAKANVLAAIADQERRREEMRREGRLIPGLGGILKV
jgi:hypothetical protein